MSTLTDIDYAIIMTKIEALEYRIKQLEDNKIIYAPRQNVVNNIMPCVDAISTINIDDVVRSI